MKKVLVVIFVILVVLASFIIGIYFLKPSILNIGNNGTESEETFFVAFNTDGAEELDQMTIVIGSDNYNLPTPTKTGYVFNGWFIQAGSAWLVFDENYQVIGRYIEVTARWDKDTENYNFYNISFNTFDLTANLDEQEIVENIAIGELPEPTESGVKFSGWFAEDGRQSGEWGSEITSTSSYDSDVTLYAKWTVIISFNTMGGTVVSDEEIGYNKAITLPNEESFSKIGFDFIAWYSDSDYEDIYVSSTIHNHVTLYAQWEALAGVTIYTVDFATNGSRENLPAIEVGEGATISNLPDANDLERDFYDFIGWFLSDNEGETLGAEFTTSSVVNNDLTLYAQWEQVDTEWDFFTITFDTQNGSSIPSIDVAEQSHLGLPNNPIRENYVFAGWYIDSACNNLYGTYSNNDLILPPVTEDLTLYAKWLTEYIITYSLDGGTNNLNNTTKYSELDLPILVQPPTKTGQVIFNGWFTNSQFTGEAITEITLSNAADFDLYANWSDPITYEFKSADNAYWITACSENYSGEITMLDYYDDGVNGNKMVWGIDDRAFYNRPNITSIEISDEVRIIGNDTFYGCNGLLSITFPSSIISIEDGAFRECLNLETINMLSLASSVSVGQNVFYSTAWLNDLSDGLIYFDVSNNKKILYDCKGDFPQNVSIEEGTIVIPADIFRDNTTLESISFSSTITEIQEGAFWGCTNLSSVTISESIDSIGTEAFRNCTSLNSIYIPENVVTMGDRVFSGCSTIVNCEADEDGNNDMPLNANGYIYNWSGSWTSPFDSITINWGQ